MTTRTLEQKIKFDSGLSIGKHCVLFTYQGRERKGLVDISSRGKVRLLIEPKPEDMYTTWNTVRGDMHKNDGQVIVWGARDPILKECFNVPTVATIELPNPTENKTPQAITP